MSKEYRPATMDGNIRDGLLAALLFNPLRQSGNYMNHLL
jgi:hypothetical protein